MADAQRPLVVSRALTVTAVVLWLFSLTQPALIIDHGTGKPDIWTGIQVFAQGWLGLGLITAGWYANLPFIYASCILLVGPKLPSTAVALGLLLALDTFRLQSLPGGGRADVYGYGLGVVVWFAAFGILLLAVAWRSAQQRGRTSLSAALREPAVYSVIAALVGAVTFYGIHAHRATLTTSLTESEFLPTGSVKNGEVCKSTVVAPTVRIALDGPLEIRGQAYPLDAPTSLLGWGIPIVRKGGFDFALNDPADINSIYWTPAAGPAAAILNLSAKHGNDTIEAVLTSVNGDVTAFRQVWTRDSRKTSIYCPDYRPDDSAPSSPPRSLLTAAVDLPGGLKPPVVSAFQNAITVAPFLQERLSIATTLGVRTDVAADRASNAGCPPNARFADQDPGAVRLGFGGEQTFAVGERRYFLMSSQPLAAVCAEESVYFYYFWIGDRKPYLLYIQRRQLAEFRKEWSLVIGFDYARSLPFQGKRNVIIRSLRERDGMVVAEVVDVEQSLVVDIQFPAPVR